MKKKKVFKKKSSYAILKRKNNDLKEKIYYLEGLMLLIHPLVERFACDYTVVKYWNNEIKFIKKNEHGK